MDKMKSGEWRGCKNMKFHILDLEIPKNSKKYS